MPRTVNPVYRRVVQTIVRHQGIELMEIPYDPKGGNTWPQTLREHAGGEAAALVIPQPNYFGVLEEADALTDWAHAQGMFAIALVNPVALALLTPPGQWGNAGADIAVGEAQPLGIPLSSGGPYIGFMCVKQELVRQMPGRIVGRTVDAAGRPGFTLTLQAREQHIRRAKATSNICTNQGLMATATTIHMALLGPEGLKRVAEQCHANTRKLMSKLTAIPGCERVFNRPVFHEVALRWNEAPASVLRALEAQAIIGGLDLSIEYPELSNCVLSCATELRSEAEMDEYALHLSRILTRRRLDPPCAVKVAPTV
jgi:glycine dehydrogenase subunit 1